MTWQDELRALDASLAAGAISAEEYRRSRDEVLAKSAMAFPEPGQEQQPPQQQGTPPPGFPQPGTPPPGFPQPGTPAPGFPQPGQPAFGAVPPWSVERTQSVNPVSGSERTQVVPGADPERTQVVQRPQGGWQRADEGGDSAPPWGRPDFQPVMPAPESWIRQGPEAFDSGFGSHRGRTIGIVVAVVVVVIGLAVGGILFFTNHNGGGTPQATQTQHPTTTTTAPLPAPPPTKAPPVDTQHALIDPPGVVRNGGGALDLPSLRTRNLLPQPMVDALTQAGMTDGLLKTTTDNGMIIGLYAFTVTSQSDAVAAAHAYAALQVGGGLASDRKHSMQGVPVYSTPPSASNCAFRAVYVLYNRVIIVETLGSDYQQVEQTFTQVLHDQVALEPPTVRTS